MNVDWLDRWKCPGAIHHITTLNPSALTSALLQQIATSTRNVVCRGTARIVRIRSTIRARYWDSADGTTAFYVLCPSQYEYEVSPQFSWRGSAKRVDSGSILPIPGSLKLEPNSKNRGQGTSLLRADGDMTWNDQSKRSANCWYCGAPCVILRNPSLFAWRDTHLEFRVRTQPRDSGLERQVS
jgi:hypothetical protein